MRPRDLREPIAPTGDELDSVPREVRKMTRDLGAGDAAEVVAFSRFLQAAGPAPSIWGTEARGELVPIGWLPYSYGLGPEPPLDLDDVAMTAWTLPG